MNLVNAVLTSVINGALFPVSRWPLLTLLVCSAITGALMTLAFRYTSNQRALGTVVDRSRGHLLAIKLFKDDLRGMFSGLFHIFRFVLARLWYSLFPVLVMIVPLLLLLAQLALRYEYRPLHVGESAIVALQLNLDAWVSYKGVKLEPNDGIVIETAPLRDDNQHTVYWRVRPTSSGASLLRWQLGPSFVEKQFIASDNDGVLSTVSSRRPGSGLIDCLLNPGEPAFGMFSPVAAINVFYPHRQTPIWGWNIPWWLTFFLVSMVVALLMQPVLHVRF